MNRSHFEQYLSRSFPHLSLMRDEAGDYVLAHTQERWEAWKEARASVVEEIREVSTDDLQTAMAKAPVFSNRSHAEAIRQHILSAITTTN